MNELKDGLLVDSLEGGVNLQEYGAWESLSLQKKVSLWCYKKDDKDDNENSVQYRQALLVIEFDIRLINFKYGPSPNDWIFWFSEPSDPFAGDFWAMIEGEEYWRMFEKGWVWNAYSGWYFDEEATGPAEGSADIDVLGIPGSWSSKF